MITGNKHTQHRFPSYSVGRFILLVVFAWIFLSAASGSFGQPGLPSNNQTISSVEQRYKEAKFYFNQLLNNQKISSERVNWAKGTQNFRRIYLSSPKSEYAAACLYMLGRLYHHMYLEFHKPVDLEESISYYKDTARLFSNHRLADDAYFAVGNIYLSEKKDPQTAALNFSKIVRQYPAGDMHTQAADMMKQLSRDYNIALPRAMVGNSALSKLNYVLPVRYWSSDDYTRIVVSASGPVSFKEELLQETKNKPRRLYIDFQDSYIEPQYRAPVPIEDGLLRQIRTGQFTKDIVRVVLDIESIDNYRIYSLPDPFRVVIDVWAKAGSAGPRFQESKQHAVAKISPRRPTNKPVILRDQKKYKVMGTRKSTQIAQNGEDQEHSFSLSLAQQLGLGVKRIILDPGHGGKDPGAIANGLKEKHIVLQLAQNLKPVLEQKIGCEVLLTRNDDTFISLEERTAIANTKGADLFISLHINAHPSPKVRGLETYYLNLSTNAEAMRVAARENATSTHQMSDLQDILSDILKNSKINESSRLALQVHEALLSGLSDNSFGEVRNLGVKQAPFYVLIGAQMPAILLEIAFISNKDDARNLKSAEFISALAQNISEGVYTYINNNTASLQANLASQRQ